jgi:membrane protease YdiL (CAAX protease family)
MPAVDEFTLLLVDSALNSVGALVAAVVLLRLLRDGRWRNPLTQLDFTRHGPGLIHLVGVIAAVWALSVILLTLSGIDAEAARISGSHEWHVRSCIDGASMLAACLLMVVILRRRPMFRTEMGRGLGPPGLLGVSVLAVLIIMPIACLQLEMGQIIWQWLAPGAQQPVHSVLEAIETSTWGPWGTMQLAFAATVVAPLSEELFFRGLLLQALWRHLGHVWLAIVLSGIGFGLIHIQLPQTVLPLVTMGIILGYVRVRYRSLTACVLVHAMFNGHTIALALLNPEMARNSS